MNDWLAMYEQDAWLSLYIILIFAALISGLLLLAAHSQYRKHNAYEPWHARLAAAEGEHRHHGNNGSMNFLAVAAALGAVSGVIVVDHFKGPSFPQVFYCLNDGGAQITRMCTGRVPPD
jgi:hypothetical protein